MTQQAIVLDLPVKACKTKDNVTVNIDIALAFRIMGNAELGEDPDLVRKFVHELKPRGLEQQLRDAQDEAVRALARSLVHTEIYGIRSGENTKHIQSTAAAAGEAPNPADFRDDGDDDNNLESIEEGKTMEDASFVSAETSPSGILGATPVSDVGHRDETLVGTADEEDVNAAKSAVAAGVGAVSEYMKQRLNRQFM